MTELGANIQQVSCRREQGHVDIRCLTGIAPRTRAE